MIVNRMCFVFGDLILGGLGVWMLDACLTWDWHSLDHWQHTHTHIYIHIHHPLFVCNPSTHSIIPSNTIPEEVDDYEYGAVDAPIGLAWGAGVLAVGTALLPIALKGGEEAFEEMKSQDEDTWGTGNSNRLNKRK